VSREALRAVARANVSGIKKFARGAGAPRAIFLGKRLPLASGRRFARLQYV
jgi:hypothetical protein